jgi:hypothetical protein
MVPPNHSWVGVEKYELHPLGQDFRFAIWPASMVHPTASVEAFSGGHGGGFVNSRANHIRDLHLGSAV